MGLAFYNMNKHRYVSLEMILMLCMMIMVYMFERVQHRCLWFPKSVFAMLLGTSMHFLMHDLVFDTEIFLFLMLPPMVLRSSLSIPLRDTRSLTPAVIFAVVGTILSCVLITWGSMSIMTWDRAILVGAILSSTDQVALTTLLKCIRASIPERLYWLLQNESFINDAVSITLMHMIQYRGSWVHMGVFLTLIVSIMCVCSRALATVMVSYQWLSPQIVLLVSMMLYCVGEFMFMSGILLLFIFGFTIRQHAKGTREYCRVLTTLLEDLVYLLLGASAYTFQLDQEIFHAVYICFVCWVARVVTSFVCGCRFFELRELCFLSMTSIRGAVAVALAFSIQDKYIQMIVFVNVLVSTIVHGSTICLLPRYLHLQRTTI